MRTGPGVVGVEIWPSADELIDPLDAFLGHNWKITIF